MYLLHLVWVLWEVIFLNISSFCFFKEHSDFSGLMLQYFVFICSTVFTDLCVYLKDRVAKRGRDLPFLGSLSNWPWRLRLGQAGARNLEPHSGLPHGWHGPNPWAVYPCFLRYISRELHRNGATVMWTGTQIRFWCCGFWFNPLHQHCPPQPQYLVFEESSFKCASNTCDVLSPRSDAGMETQTSMVPAWAEVGLLLWGQVKKKSVRSGSVANNDVSDRKTGS